MANEIKDLPAAIARITELEAQLSDLRTQINPPPQPITAREKSIRARMASGHLNRHQAEEVVEQQERQDARRSARAVKS